MDRIFTYTGAIPLETDELNTNRFAMIGLSKLTEVLLGTGTLLSGLACTPTSVPSLQVQIAPGQIYSFQYVDATAYSSLPADTTHQIVKQGLLMDTALLTVTPPTTAGQSINYLVQISYEDADINPQVLLYYNSENPAQGWSGPGNSGASQYTVRSGVCNVALKAGISAATGSQVTPAPDAGFVGAWVITVVNGATQITSGNISQYSSAPFVTETLQQKISKATADTLYLTETEADARYTQVLSSLTAMRALDKTKVTKAILVGYAAAGDAPSRVFYLDAADTTSADNGITIIVATDGGRWKWVPPARGIDIRFAGGIGDGTTANDAAVVQLKNVTNHIAIPDGTFVFATSTALSFSSNGGSVIGNGSTSIIKAANSASLAALITVSGTDFILKNLVVDGNRDNGGLAANHYGIYISGSRFTAEKVELRYCSSYGTYIGSSVASPEDIKLIECWVHDNGGIADGGFGCGIYGAGGPYAANGVEIIGGTIERNHCTVGHVGQSNGINLQATGIKVVGTTLRDNFNVNGGQLDLQSDTTNGSADGWIIVDDVIIEQSGTFLDEQTSGIELMARKVLVTNFTINNAAVDGVRCEASGGQTVISNGVVTCGTGSCVDLINSGGTGQFMTKVTDVHCLAGATGINIQSGSQYVEVKDNFISPSVTTSIQGVQYCSRVRGNSGYEPAASTSLTAGTSPYIWPTLPYDVLYLCTAVNGMYSNNIDGTSLDILTAHIPILVKGNQEFTVYWSSTAPVFNISPCQ